MAADGTTSSSTAHPAESAARVETLPVSGERIALAFAFAAIGSPLVVVLARAIAVPLWMGVVASVVVFIAITLLVPARLPAVLDGCFRRHRRVLAAVWVALTLLGSVQSARLVSYMVDPSHTQGSILADPFYVTHSCLSAYYTAARISTTSAPNLYDEALYEKPKAGSPLGEFKQDDYFYPPPFLLLPRALLAISNDFVRVRAAWFVMEMALLAAALLSAASRLRGTPAAVALLAVPLIWSAFPTLVSMQVGNFQPIAFALAVLAMAAFDRRRNALGADCSRSRCSPRSSRAS